MGCGMNEYEAGRGDWQIKWIDVGIGLNIVEQFGCLVAVMRAGGSSQSLSRAKEERGGRSNAAANGRHPAGCFIGGSPASRTKGILELDG